MADLVETQQGAFGHLAYYKQHGISPVRYRMADLGEHFDRRDALYRTLGIAPVAFRSVRVLEVAPGSGQNSQFVAACQPAGLDLVEPNPSGLEQIESVFAGLDIPHTSPVVHRMTFEKFEAAEPFDIVLCENWLGSLPHEVALLAKLSRLVAPGGAVVVTAVPYAGFFPNVMRKLLALRISRPDDGFEESTDRLSAAFGSHLDTIEGMTRSPRDWIHDCMLNPHYLNVALPFATVLSVFGSNFEVLGTSPRLAADWRWFKRRAGGDRGFNADALAAERRNLHNFVDQRHVFPERDASENDRLADLFEAGYTNALIWQTAFCETKPSAVAAASEAIGNTLDALSDAMSELDKKLGAAFGELRELWARSELEPDDVARMRYFNGVFGRETMYVALTRRRQGA